MENLGKGLLEIIRKLEINLKDFNRGIDDVDAKHRHNQNVTAPELMKKEKEILSKEIPHLRSETTRISSDKDKLKNELFELTNQLKDQKLE